MIDLKLHGAARRALAVFVVALSIGAVSVAYAQPVSVQGTKVTLDPPDGFEPSKRFPGFQSTEFRASIMVTEIPGPFSKVSEGMNRDGLATRGMRLLSSETKTVAGRDALVLSVNQSAYGQVFRKRLVVFGDEANTVVIAATFPEAFVDTVGPAIETALLSARWDRNKALDPFEGLPFRVTESVGLRIANRVSGGLLLTEGGAQGPLAVDDPLLVVTASIDDRAIGKLEDFARHRMARVRQVKDLDSIEGRSLTVSGIPAYELTADAVDSRTGKPVRIYQLTISNGRGYFLAFGMVGAGKGDRFMSQFKLVAESLRVEQ